MKRKAPVLTFVSPHALAWGEAVLGVRAARELVQRGYRATFAAPRALSSLVRGNGFDLAWLPDRHQNLPRRVPDLLARSGSKALVLVDLSTWTWELRTDPAGPGFLARLGIPLIALDLWGITNAGGPDGLGDETRITAMFPAPFLRPSLSRWSYNALPPLPPTSPSSRVEARATLGIGGRDRLVVLTSSRWQSPRRNVEDQARLARLLPSLAATLVARAGMGLHVLHIGPAPYVSFRAVLGSRYRWSKPIPPHELERILRAADLLLSFNAPASVAATAVAIGLPVLTGINSRAFDSVPRALDVLRPSPSPFLETWLKRAVPLYPFAVWPFGYYAGTRQSLLRNPYRSLLNLVEVLDEKHFVDRLRALVNDREERIATLEAQAAYRQRLRQLPGAADLMIRICEG